MTYYLGIAGTPGIGYGEFDTRAAAQDEADAQNLVAERHDSTSRMEVIDGAERDRRIALQEEVAELEAQPSPALAVLGQSLDPARPNPTTAARLDAIEQLLATQLLQ